MSELDWDDPNYQDPPAKPLKYYNEKHERSARREDNARGSSNHGDRGDFCETVEISSEQVGRFIGRRGENIIRLENDFNVRINVDKADYIVKVTSKVAANVKEAAEAIRKELSTNDTGRNGGSNDYRDERNSENTRKGRWERSESNFYEQPKPYFNEKKGRMERPDRQYYKSPREKEFVDGDQPGPIDWDAVNRASEVAQAARWAKCPQLTKDFYKEKPEVANVSKAEVERIRLENNNTSVAHVFEPKAGEELATIPNPVWRFEQCFAEYPDLLAEIKKQGFEKPSPIQAQAWPILLKGHDLIGIAQTGTGKTLAFLLPAMIHTEFQGTPRGQRGGPNVLILAPTRELALQIEMEVKKYRYRDMKAVCVYGGGSRQLQISEVERGAEIIICTPGRLNDLVQAKVINVSSITYLVLDEADRMLDMGFEPQIRKVLLDIRPDRQTVMTSATWPPGVRRLAQSYMHNPMQICVGSLDLAATHSVHQVIQMVENDKEKFQEIKDFVINMAKEDKIIVFCGRKARVDDLSSDLTLDGYLTQCIHGNRDQSDREQAIADIKSGVVRILIATDVASRGLDIEDITHVINYDFPRNIEEYVHRVGRTGRAGRRGTSISFVTREDWAMAEELINILEEAEQKVPESLRDMCCRFKAMKERRASENAMLGGGRGDRSRFGAKRY